MLFGQPIPARARETAVPERTLRRKVARFDALGMHSLFDLDALAPPTTGRRLLPPEIRRAVVELKAEYPPFGLREIATICRHRFDRRLSHHTVRAVLASEPLPVRPPRRSSGIRRGGWRPTGRAARGRHHQRKRGSLRRDTTRLAGVAGPRRPSQCLLAGIIDRHLTPLPPRRIIPDDRFI